MRLTARRAQAYAWMLLNVLAFGATIPVIKWGIGSTSPFRFLVYRFAIATLIAIPIVWYYRKEIKRHSNLMLKAIGVELIGTTGALGILYIGLTKTTSLEANLILTTSPLFVAAGGVLLLREKITKRELTGLGIATSMTVVLSWLPFLAVAGNTVTGGGNLVGNLLMVLHNLVNIAYVILAKRVYHRLPKMLVTCISAVVGLISFSLLSFWESGFSLSTWQTLVSLELSNPIVLFIAGFAAVITSYIGLTALLKGQDLIEVSEATLFTYLQPAVFIPISYFLLKEGLSPLQLICFMVVMLGVVLAEWKPSRSQVKSGNG